MGDVLAVIEQVDMMGQAVGVEIEQPSAETAEKIAEPFDPDDIDVFTKSMTVDLLLSRTDSEMIDLQPDFQRRWGVWDTRRQSRLIESLLLRIPLSVLYAAEDEDGRASTGFNASPRSPASSSRKSSAATRSS